MLNGQLKTATACGPTCHSGNGYVDTVLTGRVSDTTKPSTINCYTCHLPHTIPNDASMLDSLRGVTLAVTLVDGTSKYIHGKSNMCANCHRATGAPPTATGDLTLTDKFGPHYSAQADVVNGTAGYRFDTSVVLVNSHATAAFGNTCFTCHFGKGQGYDFGEHTFRLQYHSATKDTTPYLGNCNAPGCHSVTNVSNFYAVSSNAAAITRGDSIKLLGDTLRSLFESSFILDPTDTAGTMYKVGDVLPPVAAKILYNYLLYRHDGSRGLHNPQLMFNLLKGSFLKWDSIPPRAEFIVSDNDVCIGDSVTFTNKSRYEYLSSSWTFGDSGTSTQQSPTHAYAAVGVYPVKLTITGINNQTSLATKSLGVTVHGPITARIHVVDSTICFNGLVTLVDSSSGLPSSRQWYFPPYNSDSVFTGTSVTRKMTKIGTDTFSVVLRAFNACTPGGVDTLLRNIFIEVDSAPPVCDFSFAPATIKVGDSVAFSDLSTGARTWLWQFTLADSSRLQSPKFVFQVAGLYDVKLTISNACTTATRTHPINVVPAAAAPAEMTPRLELRRK